MGYSPYGAVTFLTAGWSPTTDAYAQNVLFQGGWLETPTGGYIFDHRDYDPATGTWKEQDPAGYLNGRDVYQIETSDPASFTDPRGLSIGELPFSEGGGGDRIGVDGGESPEPAPESPDGGSSGAIPEPAGSGGSASPEASPSEPTVPSETGGVADSGDQPVARPAELLPSDDGEDAGSQNSSAANNGTQSGTLTPPDSTSNAGRQGQPTGQPYTEDHYKFNAETGRWERSTVSRDQYGRQTARTDWTDHGRPNVHPNPHCHSTEWNSQYPEGRETGPFPGPHPDHQPAGEE